MIFRAIESAVATIARNSFAFNDFVRHKVQFWDAILGVASAAKGRPSPIGPSGRSARVLSEAPVT